MSNPVQIEPILEILFSIESCLDPGLEHCPSGSYTHDENGVGLFQAKDDTIGLLFGSAATKWLASC